jgi:hypothetical protein
MFVRFRHQRRRLYATLCRSVRVDGKPRAEHVGPLGSVAYEPGSPIAESECSAFYEQLPRRIAALPFRLTRDDERQLYDLLFARIPAGGGAMPGRRKATRERLSGSAFQRRQYVEEDEAG